MEGCKDYRSRGVPGPHTYVGGNTAKDSVSSFMGYLKGKSSVMLYEQFGELKYKYRNREFWGKGYYVDTVGKNENRIAEYIQNQLKEDEMAGQLMIEEGNPFTGRR